MVNSLLQSEVIIICDFMAKIPLLNSQIDRGLEKSVTLKSKVGKQKFMEIASCIKKKKIKKKYRNTFLFIAKKYDNKFILICTFLFFFQNNM